MSKHMAAAAFVVVLGALAVAGCEHDYVGLGQR
jgi:predicted small secreted protein